MVNDDITFLDGEFEISCPVPETVEELDALLGPGGAVAEAAANLRYRNWYPRVYKLVSAAVEKLGFKRAVKETKTLKDGTVKEVKESEMDHLRGYLTGRKDNEGNVTEPPPEGSREKLNALFLEIAPVQPLFVKGERTGFGGKISQSALDGANALVAKGDEHVENAINKIEASVPGYKIGRDADGNVTPESLARGIQAFQKHLAAEAAKQSKNELGV